jgi:hypothetical protein
VRVCRECLHYDASGDGGPECRRVVTTHPIYGFDVALSCHSERQPDGDCGPEGALWRPRPSLWRRLMGS